VTFSSSPLSDLGNSPRTVTHFDPFTPSPQQSKYGHMNPKSHKT